MAGRGARDGDGRRTARLALLIRCRLRVRANWQWTHLGNELRKILSDRFEFVATADRSKKVVRDAGETKNSPSKPTGN